MDFLTKNDKQEIFMKFNKEEFFKFIQDSLSGNNQFINDLVKAYNNYPKECKIPNINFTIVKENNEVKVITKEVKEEVKSELPNITDKESVLKFINDYNQSNKDDLILFKKQLNNKAFPYNVKEDLSTLYGIDDKIFDDMVEYMRSAIIASSYKNKLNIFDVVNLNTFTSTGTVGKPYNISKADVIKEYKDDMLKAYGTRDE